MDERACTKCGIVKPMSGYKRGTGYADGYQRQCRECVGIRRRERYANNPAPELEKSLEWGRANRDKRSAIEKRYRETHPEYAAKRIAEMPVRLAAKSTPEAKRARNGLHMAIRYGKVIRPDTCENCGAQCHPDAAHYTYEWVDRLRVRWLCRSCHVKWDQAQPKLP